MRLHGPVLTCVATAVIVCAWLDPGRVRAQVRSGVVMGLPPPRPGPRPDGAGSLRGRVVDGTTGLPLRGATISAGWRASEGDAQAQFSARTDAQGRFAIDGLPDGAYLMYVNRHGFFAAPGANQAKQVTLRGGGTLDVGDVRLMRGGVLTGRVLDSHGEPVVGARVTPVARPPGQDVAIPFGGTTVTDDRGAYRAHGLLPARYTVRVVPVGPSARGPVRLQGHEPEPLPGFATDAVDASSAEFVEVRAGEEATLDVRLNAGRLSPVAGQVVVGDVSSTTAQMQVSLRLLDPEVQLDVASARPTPDGQFEFLDVAPGRYRVVAEEPMVFAPEGPRRRLTGWLEIAVTGDPVTGIVVPLGFGALVRGRIEVDGGDQTALTDRPLQVLASALLSGNPVPSRSTVLSSTTDLAFELRDVVGHQQLQVMGLPSGWWLKSVLIDGEDAFDGREFPVSGSVDGVVLLVSSRQSGVSGRIQGSGGDLQGASVLVLPGESLDSARGPQAGRRIASVSTDGTFTASGLRPGRYRLLALSPPMRSAYDRLGREERQALVGTHGRPVDVVEGRLATVTLQLVER